MTVGRSAIEAFYADIWAELADFTRPRAGFAGLATLATRSATGPELRQVVLRGADPQACALVVHTDARSPKVAEIVADAAVSVLVWAPDAALQIRAKGDARFLPAHDRQSTWDDMPFASRGNYGVEPVPGTPIADADAYARSPDPARLAVIQVELREIDAVQLCEPKHRRARFTARDAWAGQWLAP